MKNYIGFISIFLIFLYGFEPIKKPTDSLIGIWINPTNDVKIKFEESRGKTFAFLYWTSKLEAKEHIGRIVIKEIKPYENHFKALVIAPEQRKFVSGKIEVKSINTLLITGNDGRKSVSKVYRKVSNS